MSRPAQVFGSLIVSTVNQAKHGPRIDGATTVDQAGRRYGSLVFGTGRYAPVVGWRGWTAPWPAALIQRCPRPLRPLARFLLAARPRRGGQS